MPFKRPHALRFLLALLVGAGVIWTVWRFWPSSGPLPLVLRVAGNPWPGFTPSQERGLLLLVADSLEIATRIPTVLESDLLGAIPEGASVLALKGARGPSEWAVEATWSRPNHPPQTWQASGAPRALFQTLLQPFKPRGPWNTSLIPEEAGDLGSLLEVTGWETDWDPFLRLQAGRDLVLRIPNCSSAWLALSGLEHRSLVMASDPEPQGQEKCQEHFEQTLAVLPAYPRGTHKFAIYLTDLGNQRQAFLHLEAAIKAYPKVAHLRSALAYVARSSGLLEVGNQALEVRDRLQGISKAGIGLGENLYLYRGDLDLFGKTLGDHAPNRIEPVLDFYRAYYHLLKGERTRALAEFKLAASDRRSRVLFKTLAEVYALGLEGRTEEAIRVLTPLRDQRLRLRVPDGEFTFKIAEAYCFLGQNADALLVAERAFSQGFGCTQWYEGAPLLAPLRNTPRWRALLQHLKDRQSLLESRFPPSRFR